MDINNIEQIYEELLKKSRNQNFFDDENNLTLENANNFIASFASDHDLKAHTVSPLRWRFDSKRHGEIADGVIELNQKEYQFQYVDVSDVKLTHPNIDVSIFDN